MHFLKCVPMSAAKKTMLDAMRNDLENRFAGSSMRLAIAHTNNEAMALEFKAELEKEFPGYPEIIVNELSLSVACHIETEHWQSHVPESRKYKETREIYWISMNIA